MASIQCDKCRFGIHYHGDPEGIEFVFIKNDDWTIISSSKFDPKNKQFRTGQTSPMLYQTDTIELDFEDSIRKAWKCPKCGTIMFFDSQGKITASYEEAFELESLKIDSKYNFVVFDDYSWDVLTESMMPNWKISEQFTPSGMARLTSRELILAESGGRIKTYKRLETEGAAHLERDGEGCRAVRDEGNANET